MMRWWSRLPLLVASSALLGVSVHAAAPLIIPDQEEYILVSALAGLAITAFWRWSGSSLAILTGLGAPSAAFLVWRFLPDTHAYTSVSGAMANATLTPGAGILLALCTFVLAACCGRLIFEHRTPWPAVALACSAFLLRANASRIYEERFPLFLLAAIAVVILCHAPGDRRIRVGLSTLAACALLLLLCWQLPTSIHAWSPVFSNSIGRTLATGAPGSGGGFLPLTGAFHPNNQPVMSVTTNVFNVRPYWRTAVFDRYDGHSWSVSATTERTFAANQLVSALAVSNPGNVVTAVQVFEPMLDLASAGVPLRANVPTTGQYTGASQELVALHATIPLPPGSVYRIDGAVNQGSSLSARELAPDLQIPSDLPRVRALTQQIIRAYPSTLLKVLALESYLRDSGRYHYDLQSGSPPEGDAVDNFLFVQRRGYCNQFATTLALMAREAGIPARLVTGYATGTAVGEAYLVRERDAHSWVEAYVPPRGWIAFDPTPGFHADPALVTDPRGKLSTAPHFVLGNPRPPNLGGGLGWRRRWSNRPATGSTVPIGSSTAPWGDVRLLVPIIAGGALIWLLAYLWWPRSLEQLYLGLRRATPGKFGVPEPADTPILFVERFNRADSSTAGVRYIVELYMQQEYANRFISGNQLKTARRAWRRQRCIWLIGMIRRVSGIPRPSRMPRVATPEDA